MTFLQNCIAENELEQALEYIHQICADIDNSRVIRYCENDALNLILSSYAGQASDAGIELQFTVTATVQPFCKCSGKCDLRLRKDSCS